MEIIYFPLHILSLFYVAWNVAHADHMGFSWIRGNVAKLDEAIVKKYHKATWIGLILMIVTGVLLFLPAQARIVYPQFYIKMGFVGALLINSIVIGKLSKTPTIKTFASLSTKEKIPLFISGAVSTISWVGAALMALFIFAE